MLLVAINHNLLLHDNVSHETESLLPLLMTHYRLHNYTVKLAFPPSLLQRTNRVRHHFSLNSDNGQTSSSILRHHPSLPTSHHHPLRPSPPPPHHRPQSRRVDFHCRHLLLLVKVSTGHSHHPLLLSRWRL